MARIFSFRFIRSIVRRYDTMDPADVKDFREAVESTNFEAQGEKFEECASTSVFLAETLFDIIEKLANRIKVLEDEKVARYRQNRDADYDSLVFGGGDGL